MAVPKESVGRSAWGGCECANRAPVKVTRSCNSLHSRRPVPVHNRGRQRRTHRGLRSHKPAPVRRSVRCRKVVQDRKSKLLHSHRPARSHTPVRPDHHRSKAHRNHRLVLDDTRDIRSGNRHKVSATGHQPAAVATIPKLPGGGKAHQQQLNQQQQGLVESAGSPANVIVPSVITGLISAPLLVWVALLGWRRRARAQVPEEVVNLGGLGAVNDNL